MDWSLVPARSHKPVDAGSNPALATRNRPVGKRGNARLVLDPDNVTGKYLVLSAAWTPAGQGMQHCGFDSHSALMLIDS